VTFRTRLFLTSLAATTVALLVATVLVSYSVRRAMDARIEQSLVNEARLAAETLSHRQAATPEELDAEADAIGRLVTARVTFVARDGTVVGDSELNTQELRTLENHGGRPEIVQSRREGLGIARRHSTTLGTEMLYVAVPVSNQAASLLSEVRLALPLTAVGDQLATVRRLAFYSFLSGLGIALAVAWVSSALIGRRVRAIAAAAKRYASGDFSQPARDYGNDEIGTVAGVLDESVREIGRRASDLASDRARMEAILTGMIEGVLVVDDQGHVQLVNGAARRMLKLQDEPEGRHYLEIVRQPDIAGRIGAALRGESSEGLELWLPRDSERTIIARTAPVRAGSVRGAVLVIHDITDLRRADRIRRDFVANVSHELRTPLTAVQGYVEALLDGTPDAAESKKFLEIVGRHTMRMERLVRDLLRLARLDAGQETLEKLDCSVESLFSGVTTELADVLEARRVRVEQRIERNAETVPGDPAKLHDAFRNLLENAANYSPESGLVVMSAERDKAEIVLAVTDEGPGVPDTDLPRIFERFYRADKARARATPDPGGTGLGLAIVKHLIELHGGRVNAANRPNSGAVFTVRLPL
jgi:two-component system, OmpR family, phosphate regulon sensor histidine kinase PhoR